MTIITILGQFGNLRAYVDLGRANMASQDKLQGNLPRFAGYYLLWVTALKHFNKNSGHKKTQIPWGYTTVQKSALCGVILPP